MYAMQCLGDTMGTDIGHEAWQGYLLYAMQSLCGTLGTDIGQEMWQGYLLYAAFLQASMAETRRGQMGGNSTAVCVPHHNQTIIATCHQGMVALQAFSSWVSGCTCLLVLTDATKRTRWKV